MGKQRDLTGLRVGRLTVVEPAERKNGRTAWKCLCDCGNNTVVLTASLTEGHTNSCGCYHKERTSETFKKHGQFGTRLYRIWSNMVQRCGNPNSDSYYMYGETGITVCDEWRDFSVFYEWAMANGYADDLSIDRMENDKGYYPENCRWATPKEQTDNRRCTHYLSYKGKRQTLKAWSDETGIPYKNLLWRVQHNWPVERALSK